MEHTIKELQMLQALPLKDKVEMTKERIKAWVDHFGLDHVSVSFSGGKDSTEGSDLHFEITHRQRSSVGTQKVFRPHKALNDENGLCRTIKSQYYKNSIDNFVCHGSFGATGVIRKLEEVSNDRTDG